MDGPSTRASEARPTCTGCCLKRSSPTKKSKTYRHRASELIRECLADSRLKSSRCCTFPCGAVGILALAAVVLGKAQYAHQLLKWKPAALDTESNELLFGKSGYLAALLFVRDHADFSDASPIPRRAIGKNSDFTSDYFSKDSEALNEQARLSRLGHELLAALRKAIQEVSVRMLLDGDRVAKPDPEYWEKTRSSLLDLAPQRVPGHPRHRRHLVRLDFGRFSLAPDLADGGLAALAATAQWQLPDAAGRAQKQAGHSGPILPWRNGYRFAVCAVRARSPARQGQVFALGRGMC